ncbi:carbohydrate ABC transporter permease [Treponema parvum]|uniref:Carbohydrate ABC transporter permease n=1 Tax=Treponema parvum TaxID=138851 RepID=A0A975IBE4_9SPIR|nr:carbohydrate ABC transporter permease [Treponema parvum]QTQ10936.1 carbohydrate ABC transporter permease [Treponema parvum]QTQ17118.1 carbohydrate ABC transporter permease [Treponema parvum]
MNNIAKKKIENLIWYIVLFILFLYLFIPFWWMVVTSFKTYSEVYSKPYSLMFTSFHWQNYPDVLKSMPFFNYLWNTIKVSVFVCLGTLVTSGMAAYAFSRLYFPGRDMLFYIYLATLMIPRQVILIPNFLLFRRLGLLDTHWALILSGTFTAYGTFLLRQFFLTIPRELEEAAVVDGYGYFSRFVRIIIPLAKPALTTLLIITLLNIWNEYLYALVFLQSDHTRTLTLGLALLRGDFDIKWNQVMAATIFSIAPIVVVYLSAQRYFVEGIALTGIKG